MDLGEGGVFLESELLLEIGDEVLVTFELPDRRHEVSTRARVAWATRNADPKGTSGMGLEFVDLGAADREAIAAVVSAARGVTHTPQA